MHRQSACQDSRIERHIRGEGAKLAKLAKRFQILAIFWRARSRLYRNEILQENMRLKALAEIYTMHSFAQLCNLNFLSKIRQAFAKFCKLQQI